MAPTTPPIAAPTRYRNGNADRGPAVAVADVGGGEDAAEADRGADGEVDAAHQHDQGLGERHDGDRKPVLGEAGDARRCSSRPG